MAQKVNASPQTLKLLNEFVNTEKIQDMGIAIMPLAFDSVTNSHVARLTSGLMINDSIIVAGMKQERIKLLATGDKSFEPVPKYKCASPRTSNSRDPAGQNKKKL